MRTITYRTLYGFSVHITLDERDIERVNLKSYGSVEFWASLSNLVNSTSHSCLYEDYRDSIKEYLRATNHVDEDTKILVLGAGIPSRFPEEWMKNITAVDLSYTIAEKWKKLGVGKMVVDNVINFKDMNDYDIVILPAIINWIEAYGTCNMNEFLDNIKENVEKGTKIIIFDTTYSRYPYYDDREILVNNHWVEGIRHSLPYYINKIGCEIVSLTEVCHWRVKLTYKAGPWVYFRRHSNMGEEHVVEAITGIKK